MGCIKDYRDQPSQLTKYRPEDGIFFDSTKALVFLESQVLFQRFWSAFHATQSNSFFASSIRPFDIGPTVDINRQVIAIHLPFRFTLFKGKRSLTHGIKLAA